MSYLKFFSVSFLFALMGAFSVHSLHAKPKKSNFEIGYDFYEAHKYEEAKKKFTESLKESETLKTYAQYYLASIEFELGHSDQAEAMIKEIFNSKPRPSEELRNRSLYLYSKVQEKEGDWKAARLSLSRLSRKWRYSPHYPEVLYNLIRAEIKRKRSRSACYFAKKLYTYYPQHELLEDWGVDLRTNEIDGKPLHCSAPLRNVATRIRRLQLSGQSERARTEILELREKLEGKEKDELDLQYARFLVNEGMVEEALSLLMKEYPRRKGEFDYLMRLAYAASRGGEARMAIGAYEKAHKLNPRSRDGREALFQAAFLSYQFQDYDGAIRKFTELVKDYPRSGLARDAKWHLAWLHYLRSDFKGALKRFEEARAANNRRRRRRSEKLDEKLLYWQSMAHLRLDQTEEAEKGFINLIQSNPYSFYSLLSRARLEQFAASSETAKKTAKNEKGKERQPAVAAWKEFSGTAQMNPEDEESEEKLAEEELPEADQEASMEPEEIFKDAKSLERLQAAQALMDVGQSEWARWELYEIEKKSRSSQVRRRLITLYEKLGAYHRSARISELYFGMERHKFGLQTAADLWKSMFPEAFKNIVTRESSRHGIPKEWIWGIMRAESLFRPDIVSPVGAKGLMQIMPYTGAHLARLRGDKSFDVQDLFVPQKNVALGSQYLERLSHIFAKCLPVMAASYNAGPHRVKRWIKNFGYLEADEFIEHIPFVETRNYVKKVLTNQFYYQALYNHNLHPAKWLIQPLGVPIPEKISAHENWEAL